MEKVNRMEWRRHEVYVNYGDMGTQIVARFKDEQVALDHMKEIFDNPYDHIDESWSHEWLDVTSIAVDECEGGRFKLVGRMEVNHGSKPIHKQYPLVPWYARKILLALLVDVCYKEIKYRHDSNGNCHRRMTFVKSTELMLGEPIKELRCKPIIIKYPWKPVPFEGY